MKLAIAAATILGIFGTALLVAPTQATPSLPSQCPGVIGDYNVLEAAMVLDLDGVDVGIWSGTEDADLIVVNTSGGGVVSGEGGNDCIVWVNGSTFFVVDGGEGNDVIIGNGNPTYEVADGAGGTDRCIGFAFDTCELH